MSKSIPDKGKKSGRMTNPGLHKPVSPIITLHGSPTQFILDARLDAISHSRPLVPEDLLKDRIRQRREEKQLTQEALAILTRQLDPLAKGISRPSIVAYEKGDTLPGTRELRLLSDALNVTPSWLVLGEYDAPQDVDIEATLSKFIYAIAKEAAHDAVKEIAEHHEKMERIHDEINRLALEKGAIEEAKKETRKRNRPKPPSIKGVDS